MIPLEVAVLVINPSANHATGNEKKIINTDGNADRKPFCRKFDIHWEFELWTSRLLHI
jgi:hypothetical protein